MRAWLSPLPLLVVAIACSSHEDLDLPVPVALQPLGHVGKGDVARVERALERQFNVQVTVLPLQALPKEAFTKPRQRWRTEKLRAYLDRSAPGRFQRVMGLTDRDISTTHRGHYDYGIAGEATINGRPCVVSSFRLKKKVDAPELAARLEQTAIHELAHTFGLGHCPDRGSPQAPGHSVRLGTGRRQVASGTGPAPLSCAHMQFRYLPLSRRRRGVGGQTGGVHLGHVAARAGRPRHGGKCK